MTEYEKNVNNFFSLATGFAERCQQHVICCQEQFNWCSQNDIVQTANSTIWFSTFLGEFINFSYAELSDSLTRALRR